MMAISSGDCNVTDNVFISPPFGNWIKLKNCTRIRGSFTLHSRPGLLRNTLKSLRPIKGGWINRIGLRNPGVHRIDFADPAAVYSIVGLEQDDWRSIGDVLELAAAKNGFSPKIEINLGCPNVHEYGINLRDLQRLVNKVPYIQAKLPPTAQVETIADLCVAAGIKLLHLCNTIPTQRGGESGRRLKSLNLPIVEKLARKYPNITIIAGGGIYSAEDVIDYIRAGATKFSLCTVLFTPWQVPNILFLCTRIATGAHYAD